MRSAPRSTCTAHAACVVSMFINIDLQRTLCAYPVGGGRRNDGAKRAEAVNLPTGSAHMMATVANYSSAVAVAPLTDGALAAESGGK